MPPPTLGPPPTIPVAPTTFAPILPGMGTFFHCIVKNKNYFQWNASTVKPSTERTAETTRAKENTVFTVSFTTFAAQNGI